MPANKKAVVRSSVDWARIIVAVLEEAGVESATARLPQLLRGAEQRTGQRLGPSVAAAAKALQPCHPLQLPDILRSIFAFLPLLAFEAEPGAELVCRAWRREAQWHLFRHVRTDAVHPSRAGAYLLQAAAANAQPLSLQLRLRPQDWMVIPWLLANVDVSGLQWVHLSESTKWAAPLFPQDRARRDWVRYQVPVPVPVRLRAAADSYGQAVDVDGGDYHSAELERQVDGKNEEEAKRAALERRVIEALDRLPVLRKLALRIHFSDPHHAGQALARWSLASLECYWDTLCGVPSLSHLQMLKCFFSDPHQPEACLAFLPHLRSLTIIGRYRGGYWYLGGGIRLASRSLEHVSLTRSGKHCWISYVQCPQLRHVQGVWSGYVPYGTGFVPCISGSSFRQEDIEKHIVRGGVSVFTKADGFTFCWPDGEVEQMKVIEFGEGGEPGEDCRWELVDA